MVCSSAPAISLAGEWQFRPDPQDRGLEECWFADNWSASGPPLSEADQATITLPGSMTENGLGDEITLETPWVGRVRDTSFFTAARYEKYRLPGQIKVPFWLTPLKYYKGPAWYRRTFEVPVEWAEQSVLLRLERVHWTSRVWVDGSDAGFCDSLGTPHLHRLGVLSPGQHELLVRVDNRMHVDIGEDSNSISDHSQTNWNGVIGAIELLPVPRVWISDLQVFPAKDRRSIQVKFECTRSPGSARTVKLHADLAVAPDGVGEGRLAWRGHGLEEQATRQELATFASVIEISGDKSNHEVRVELPQPALPWDEFAPNLYTVSLTLKLGSGGKLCGREVRFGFRNLETRGSEFYLNEQRVFLRGTVEDCIFPLTGYPPTDKAPWQRIMSIVKGHGLNHIRCHSWCPPAAAFDAADEAGVYLSVECGSWASVGTDPIYDGWLYREAAAMLREYGNHPSFCMMLYGNEPYGGAAAEHALAKFVEHYKALDPRRLYSSGTAWPQLPENNFHVWHEPRIQLWDQNLDSRINAEPPQTTADHRAIIERYPQQPVISHEIGQWCVYPNFEEISKYTGVSRARNFEIFRDFLADSGQAELAPDFLMASGRLQVLCYKEEIESALRTPGMGGFQMLCLHDFSGQGTALVGMLDAFWDEKPYVDAEEIREFAGPVVPLARLGKRVFLQSEILHVQVQVAQFGEAAIAAGVAEWRLLGEAGDIISSGEIAHASLAAGNLCDLGQIKAELAGAQVPQQLTLEVSVDDGRAINHWDIWVYPDDVPLPPAQSEVYVARRLDTEARQALAAGGRVLLVPHQETIAGDARGQVPAGFSSIFWNTAWTQGQQPHTLGILCDPAHPALADFPTEYHSNWQWWYCAANGHPMIMDPLGHGLEPIVRVIDDWFTARRLGYIFECQFGGGSLLVCSIDLLARNLDPVRRQLFSSLRRYMAGPEFKPAPEISESELSKVILPWER